MKLSIVIATYNGHLYVREQLESVFQNSVLPDEIVIIDDNSNDKTVEYVYDVLSVHSTIKSNLVVNEHNMGATKAFVQGTLLSTGDIVLFCDQDDVWHPDKILRIRTEFSAAPDTIMVYHDGLVTNRDLKPIGKTIFNSRGHAQLSMGSHRPPLEVGANPDIKGCTMALKGSFIRNLFSTSEPAFTSYWGHDHWAALFAFATGQVRVIHEPLILHRFHKSNTSSAVAFDPWSPRHWMTRYRMAMNQGHNHGVMRYRIAFDHAVKSNCPAAWKTAVRQHLDWSSLRAEAAAASFCKRVTMLFPLWRNGFYSTYHNGLATLLRDLFL